MKETGIVRKIDCMGRVVLPHGVRRKYKLNYGDLVEIYTDNEGIYLKKYRPRSDFLNQVEELYRMVESLEKELQDTKELTIINEAKSVNEERNYGKAENSNEGNRNNEIN